VHSPQHFRTEGGGAPTVGVKKKNWTKIEINVVEEGGEKGKLQGGEKTERWLGGVQEGQVGAKVLKK